MSIKVIQINSGDLIGRRFNGFDLRPHLSDHGVTSKQLVYWNKQTDADFVSQAFSSPGHRYVTRAFTLFEKQLSLHARVQPHSWSLPYHREVREADIAHLHIIHDGYFSISALPFLARRKPTVWTWHDPWAMTGHCIYPLECDRWLNGCGSCPDLSLPFPMRKDKTAEQFEWKKKVYSETKAEIVVASTWMRDMALRSPLAEGFNINVIPFGLDLDNYKPRDRSEARLRLGVYPDRKSFFIHKIFLFKIFVLLFC